MTATSVATLKLVQECKIHDLLPDGAPIKRFEASGVLAKGSDYFVVFDDRSTLAKIANDLHLSNSNDLIGTAPLKGGYDGIAYNAEKHRYNWPFAKR